MASTTLGWNTFTCSDWEAFTCDQWEAFTCEPISPPLDLGNIPFGHIRVQRRHEGTLSLYQVVFTEEYEETNKKMIWNGMPISLVKLGSLYAPVVTRDGGGFVNTGKELNYQGTWIQIGQKDELHALGVIENTTASTTPMYYTYIGGIPLAVNENKELILAEKEHVIVEDYPEVDLGGMPINISRLDDEWYLIITTEI